MQKRGKGKEVQPPEEPKPPRTTHKLLQVFLFTNFVLMRVNFSCLPKFKL